MIPKRPALRWHGGKWKLADWIISNMPTHRTYVEPFGGAASVLLKKSRAYAEVYNDLDGEVVNLFRVLRDHGAELRTALELTPFARVEFLASYTPSDDPIEQARRTVVRSFMGFGSNAHNKATGFRANTTRSGTTPAQDWRNYPSVMGNLIERLRGVVIENRDATAVMLAHDGPETLHYVDPPYMAATRDKGSDYRHELTDNEHEALSETLHGLEGFVMLSGYNNSMYDDLYHNWQKVEKNTLADGAKTRTESLWLSPNCSVMQLFA